MELDRPSETMSSFSLPKAFLQSPDSIPLIAQVLLMFSLVSSIQQSEANFAADSFVTDLLSPFETARSNFAHAFDFITP
jgi:hypothetical protein